MSHLEVCLDLLHGWQGVVPEQGVHAHHDARRAEATLRPVRLGNPLLNGVQLSPAKETCSLHFPFKYLGY